MNKKKGGSEEPPFFRFICLYTRHPSHPRAAPFTLSLGLKLKPRCLFAGRSAGSSLAGKDLQELLL
uniref:Uncharacterized protein n=1 Tax=Citrifermentans bremense TaxID=60035 RepID=A0A6S6M1H0_9BACT